MNEIFDRLILLLCCTTLYLLYEDYTFAIVPIIITIVLSCLFLYYENMYYKVAGVLLYCLLCFFLPSYLIFTPIVFYDILHTRYQWTSAFLLLLLPYQLEHYHTAVLSFSVAFFLLSYYLKFRTDRINKLTQDYNELRDNSVQISLLLEQKNQNLLQNQDYEVNLATLNERNRISKEIHDNVGHLLSRALLQVGALTVIAKEENIKESLTDLKTSLSVGMDQIRNSIHNMYDESIDLYMQIEHLVKEFTFCDIAFDYDIKNPPSLKLKQSFIAITKESLANIIRHSNATKVNLALREHPAMYQLVIQDNGTLNEKKQKMIADALDKQEYCDGMGLRNIYDRVKTFQGNLNVTASSGFNYSFLFLNPLKNRKIYSIF